MATDGDHVYPIGALRAHRWFAWWDRDSATYAETGGPVWYFELVGIAETAAAALAGAPGDRIDLQAPPPLPMRTLGGYPHTTKTMLTPVGG